MEAKLSEIRTHYEIIFFKDTRAFYLLDLVKRLRKALEEYGDHSPSCDVGYTACTCGWDETSPLLEELER